MHQDIGSVNCTSNLSTIIIIQIIVKENSINNLNNNKLKDKCTVTKNNLVRIKAAAQYNKSIT